MRASIRAVPPYAAALALLLGTLSPLARAAAPDIAAQLARFDQLDAPGVTALQRRFVLLEGELIFGTLPCDAALRWDRVRGPTLGCLQFGMLGRLQPVLASLEANHPELFDQAFGPQAPDVRAMLRLPSVAEQAAWGRALIGADGQLAPPWPDRFARVLALPEFQAAYLHSTIPRFQTATTWARTLGLRSSRGLAMMFDLALYRGIAPDDMPLLAKAAAEAASGKQGSAAERARMEAIATARSAIEPEDAALRQHLDVIAAGQGNDGVTTFDLAALGLTAAPNMSENSSSSR